MNGWVWLSLLAMVANVLKVLVTKHLCRGIDARLVVLAGRAGTACVLVPVAVLAGLSWPSSGRFWIVTLVTVLLTAAASTLLTLAVQRGLLTVVMPLQAAVPVFMQAYLALGFGDYPSPVELLLTTATAVALGIVFADSARSRQQPPPQGSQSQSEQPIRTDSWPVARSFLEPLLSLAAASLFGLTTVLDRIAIQAAGTHGPLQYSACWNSASTLVMLATLWVPTVRSSQAASGVPGAKTSTGKTSTGKTSTGKTSTRDRGLAQRDGRFRPLNPRWGLIGPLAAFATTSLVAFYAQQAAVGNSLMLANGVVAVKLLIMLHLPAVALIGLLVLREPVGWLTVGGGLTSIVGSSALVAIMR